MKKLVLIPIAAAFALTACGETDTVTADDSAVEDALPADVMPEQPPIDGTLSDETMGGEMGGEMGGDVQDVDPDLGTPQAENPIADAPADAAN